MNRLTLFMLLALSICLSACVQYSTVLTDDLSETNYAPLPLKSQLLRAKAEYQDKDALFIIDVVYKDISVMQILRRQMLEDVNDQQFGFGIHLNFDLQETEEFQQLLEFHQLPVLDLFTLYEVINSPTFQLDLKEDMDQLEAMTWMLLKTIYSSDSNAVRFELSDMEFPTFFDIPDNLSKLKGPSSQLPY